MAPHQRLLHAALGVARDVASRSGVAAGACSHLRERIVSGPLCLAAGRHITCASYHSQVAAAEPLAIRATAATATVPASNEAGDGSGTAQEAGTQQSPPLNGQLVHPSRDFVYEGPLSVPVRRLKKLSLFSCACSLAAAPIIASLGDAASSAGARASIAVMVATIGIFTTGLLHWFTSPYVQRLAYDAATGVVETRTLTLLARPRVDRFPAVAVRYPQTLRPQATFQVNGKVFYVDADHFGDSKLLAMLSPPDPDQPQPQPGKPKAEGPPR